MFFSNKRKMINDKIYYIIPEKVISDTTTVLCDYASIEPSNEGLVYWGGLLSNDKITITAVIAPKTESNWGRISTSHRSNFEFVKILNKKEIVQIAQVHSHPEEWVEHSPGDNKWAAFKSEGLVSIVVPNYCKNGMLPLTKCGVHRYMSEKFIRLHDDYVKTHFEIRKNLKSDFLDLRK